MDHNVRQRLTTLWHQGISAVNGRACVEAYFAKQQHKQACHVLAVGKAAVSMMQGAQAALGTDLLSGLVVAPYGSIKNQFAQHEHILCYEAAHPLPDANSLLAGSRVKLYVDSLLDEEPLWVLLSGGASALIESLPPQMTLKDLQRINTWLLASGLAIADVNTIRQKLSLLKAGGLAQFAPTHTQVLVLSDVPGDDMAVIGSGPFYKDDHEQRLEQLMQRCELPAWLMPWLLCPSVTAHASRTISHTLIGSNAVALAAIDAYAQTFTPAIFRSESLLVGDVSHVAQAIMQTLQQQQAQVYVWGAEPTVTLPAVVGCGGRNQALALQLAIELNRGVLHKNVQLLVAGSDGVDGNSKAAGAFIDNSTYQRCLALGISPEAALAAADSGSVFEALGDTWVTGATGTNVMDIIVAWVD